MRYLLIILLFASCTTQRKAEQWMDNHPDSAASYFKDKYPYHDSIIVRVDAIKLEADVTELMLYADSMARIAQRRNDQISTVMGIADQAIQAKDFTEARFKQLRDSISKIRNIDVPALTASIEAKIRATLKPCRDTTIYQENTAKLAYYTAVEKDYNRLKADKLLLWTVLGWLLGLLAHEVWFWVVVLALAALIWIRWKFGTYTSIFSSIKNKI